MGTCTQRVFPQRIQSKLLLFRQSVHVLSAWLRLCFPIWVTLIPPSFDAALLRHGSWPGMVTLPLTPSCSTTLGLGEPRSLYFELAVERLASPATR